MPVLRGASPTVYYPSAARTATPATTELRIGGGSASGVRGFLVLIDCTAIVSTPSVTFAIETSTGPADAYASVLTSAAVVGTGSTMLLIHPSAPTERANVIDTGPLETKYRIVATHGNANSITYSVTVWPLG